MLSVPFAGEDWMLHPGRALYWPRMRTLIIADLHFGKGSLFRAAGVPVPAGSTSQGLDALSSLINELQPARLLILGDFFHGKASRQQSTLDTISRWRQRQRNVEMLLVRGNHDRHAGDPSPDWRIECRDAPLREGSLAFCHEPCALPDVPVICGHVHPAAHVKDFDGSMVKIPCFVVEPNQMILPAFGKFTGTHGMSPSAHRQIYLAAAGKVVKLRS